MRSVSGFTWSILLILPIALLVLSSSVAAAKFEGLFELSDDWNSFNLQNGKFSGRLQQVLRGATHLPAQAFPKAEVVSYGAARPKLGGVQVTNEAIEQALRGHGDDRRLFILGRANPSGQELGYSFAFHLGKSAESPGRHVFAFVSAEHRPNGAPVVHVRGAALVTDVPHIEEDILQQQNLWPNDDRRYIKIGHLVTTRELFSKLHEGRDETLLS